MSLSTSPRRTIVSFTRTFLPRGYFFKKEKIGIKNCHQFKSNTFSPKTKIFQVIYLLITFFYIGFFEYLSKQPNHCLPRFPPPGLVQLPWQIGFSMLFPMVFQAAGGVTKSLPGSPGSKGHCTGNADAGSCFVFCA